MDLLGDGALDEGEEPDCGSVPVETGPVVQRRNGGRDLCGLGWIPQQLTIGPTRADRGREVMAVTQAVISAPWRDAPMDRGLADWLSRLGPQELVEVLRDVLAAEANRVGAGPGVVHSSGEIYRKDGGVGGTTDLPADARPIFCPGPRPKVPHSLLLNRNSYLTDAALDTAALPASARRYNWTDFGLMGR